MVKILHLSTLESKDNVHISVLPPGANPDGDLSQFITNTQYYPVRRTVGITSNYVPGFLEPIPKPKPFRNFLNPKKQFQTKKVYAERKSISLSNNAPKTVKINGFEAPAILPRPRPRPSKFIITKDGIKDIESKPITAKAKRPTVVRRPRPNRNRLNTNRRKYDTVKVGGFEAPAILPRPKSRQNPIIITKDQFENVKSSRASGARRLDTTTQNQQRPSPNRVILSDEEYYSRINGNVFGQSSNYQSDDYYDDTSTDQLVYNDFYV